MQEAGHHTLPPALLSAGILESISLRREDSVLLILGSRAISPQGHLLHCLPKASTGKAEESPSITKQNCTRARRTLTVPWCQGGSTGQLGKEIPGFQYFPHCGGMNLCKALREFPFPHLNNEAGNTLL